MCNCFFQVQLVLRLKWWLLLRSLTGSVKVIVTLAVRVIAMVTLMVPVMMMMTVTR